MDEVVHAMAKAAVEGTCDVRAAARMVAAMQRSRELHRRLQVIRVLEFDVHADVLRETANEQIGLLTL